MGVGRGAAAKKAKVFHGRDPMPGSGGNEDSIALGDQTDLPVYLHLATAAENEVELFGTPVVVAGRGTSRDDPRLSQTLVPHGSVR